MNFNKMSSKEEKIKDEETGTEETVSVKIPAGFAASQVEGENTIEDGLVIIDENGNEFVWVSVDYSEFERNFDTVNGYTDVTSTLIYGLQ